jgi:hypothetical protein
VPRILPPDTNLDEQRVGPYTLPDPLIGEDGRPILSADEWAARRRPELVETFSRSVYGCAPKKAVSVTVHEAARNEHALYRAATHLEIDLELELESSRGPSHPVALSLWTPNAVSRAPVILGLNYLGNHSVHADPQIRLPRGWVPREPELGHPEHEATDAARGAHREQWPLEAAVARGYAVATVYAGDLDPDFDDGFANGVHGLYRVPGAAHATDDWGAIAAWAFGLSRALDALQQLDRVDAKRVAVLGHSRLGKAALWAGALDQRFAAVISNCSGHGGASLFRRQFGERLHHLTARFPHWFAGNLRTYEHAESELPIDQHQLLSLIAPRPLFVGSADEDLWADPRGEYLSLCHAAPVYALFGIDVPARDAPYPEVGTTVGGLAAYHRRKGAHGLPGADFLRYVDFLDRWLVA